ncbi:hypothetical protein IAT38_006534 [Cryptococcus sp. DSM 104549]
MAAHFGPLLAKSYTEIGDRRNQLDDVRRELNVVINAQPTQVYPTERELYLDALLVDLEEKEGAVWTSWPADVYLLALTAIKSLGRNPVGSETLLTHPHLSTLFFHSVLPFSPAPPPIPQPPAPTPPPAREALKILANLLVLHAAGRNRFFNAGGAAAVARALAGKGLHGEDVVRAKEDEVNTERVFLLGRLGFLVTMERPKAVAEMLEEDVVDSLVEQLVALSPVPAHFMALGEVLKMVNNILHFFPFGSAGGSEAAEDPWDERLDILLYPLLSIFHNFPTTTLAPPLSTAINTLLSIPFIPRLLPTWSSIPEPDSLSTSASISSPISPATTMRNLLTKLGNMASPSSQPRKLSAETLLPPRSTSPGGGAGSAPNSPRASSSSKRPSLPPVPLSNDPTALPGRLLRVLDGFFEAYLPYPTKPDDTLQKGLVLDEALPPVLLLLTRAAMGSEKMRVWLKEALLPSTLDRSPEAGPLEMRKGVLGNILRLMGCAGHTQTRNAAGEFMWAVCKGDPADLCVEIGYGNAAGILFQKGLSGPPPAKIEEIPDHASSSHSTPHPISLNPQLTSHPPISDSGSPITIQPATPTAPSAPDFSEPLHPITGLRYTPDSQAGLKEMTQEEKEREAERLFVLFERMERNPVISMKSGEDKEKGGEGKKDVKIKELMREQLEKGNVAEWEKKDEEEERRRLEEEERKDEEQAVREVEEYRRRMGRK